RAFIYSLRPLGGVADLAESEHYQCGRALLERLADSAEGENDPTWRLNPEQVAQVCDYLRSVEPFAPERWWDDPKDAPSHVTGFPFVLSALADSLRVTAVRRGAERAIELLKHWQDRDQPHDWSLDPMRRDAGRLPRNLLAETLATLGPEERE